MSSRSEGLPAGDLRLMGTLRAAWLLYMARPVGPIVVFAVATLLGIGTEIGAQYLAGAAAGNPNVAVGIFLFVPVTFYVVIGTVASVIVGLAMVNRLTGNDPTISAGIGSMSGSWRDLLATGVFAAVIALCFTALLPLTPLFISVFFGAVVAAHVVAFEGGNMQSALTRMRTLMSGAWTRAIMNLFTLALGLGLADYTFRSWMYQATDGAPDLVRFLAVVGAKTFVVGLVGPIYAAALLVVYLDVRVKNDDLTHESLVTERSLTGG